MPFKNAVNETLNITIAIKKNTSQKSADPLSNNGNQYLKEYRYRKALIKQLT